LLFLCGGALGAFVSWVIARPEQRRLDQAHESAIRTWKRSWICARCGHSWIPADPAVTS
jgi:kynureninase